LGVSRATVFSYTLDYLVSDMVFSPHQIVWHPLDIIACGGTADMADGQTIVVEIPGIGSLCNRLT
jgi:hypothetical protein